MTSWSAPAVLLAIAIATVAHWAAASTAETIALGHSHFSAARYDQSVTTWTYDRLHRLIGQQETDATATFDYDPAGNILVKWHQGEAPLTMDYDSAHRLLTGVQGAELTTFTHSPQGNLTGEQGGASPTTYLYDHENRLIQVVQPDGTRSTYTYAGGFPVDVEGLRRTAQEPGGLLTTFIWDGTDYLMEKT